MTSPLWGIRYQLVTTHAKLEFLVMYAIQTRGVDKDKPFHSTMQRQLFINEAQIPLSLFKTGVKYNKNNVNAPRNKRPINPRRTFTLHIIYEKANYREPTVRKDSYSQLIIKEIAQHQQRTNNTFPLSLPKRSIDPSVGAPDPSVGAPKKRLIKKIFYYKKMLYLCN